MEAELTRLDAVELADLIRSRKASSFDIVQAHLERIAAVDPKLNAIVTINNNALEAAKAADAAVLSGEKSLGPLHGVPFTVRTLAGRTPMSIANHTQPLSGERLDRHSRCAYAARFTHIPGPSP